MEKWYGLPIINLTYICGTMSDCTDYESMAQWNTELREMLNHCGLVMP